MNLIVWISCALFHVYVNNEPGVTCNYFIYNFTTIFDNRLDDVRNQILNLHYIGGSERI